MSTLTAIRRSAIDNYLRALRTPIDAGIKVVTRGDDQRLAPAKLIVDRADATVRQMIGRLLNDDELVADAGRRQLAADERARALELRAAAATKSRQADEEFARRSQQAAQREQDARQKAETERRRAEAARREEERKVSEEARRRADASHKVEAVVEKSVIAKARKAKLDQLETEAEALQREEVALSAAEKARRLKAGAEAVKAARKTKTGL